MKKALLVIACVALTGCTPKTNLEPYWSIADIPVISETNTSELVFVSSKTNKLAFGRIGVFAAVDNDTLNYVLIAPRKSEDLRNTNSPYDYFNFNSGVALRENNVQEFLSVLNRSIKEWSRSLKYDEALYFEYHLTPEQEAKLVSPHVLEVNPTLHFMFQLNVNGPEAFCQFEDNGRSTYYFFVEAGQLSELAKNLERALDKVNGS